VIYGDPDAFAILWDEVEGWSTQTFRNGLIGLMCGGSLIGNRLFKATLGPELLRLSHVANSTAHLSPAAASTWDAAAVYALALQQHHEETDEFKGSLLLSPWALDDAGFFVFLAVDDNGLERLVFPGGGGTPEDMVVAPGSVGNVVRSMVERLS